MKKVCPLLKLKVFVDDVIVFMEGRNKGACRHCGKGFLRAMRREVEEKGPNLSITERGKEGKSMVIASCSYLKKKFQESSTREGVVGLATSVKTLGVDLRTTTKRLGAKEKARRKKCDVWFSFFQEESRFPHELHEDWCEDVASDEFGSVQEDGEGKRLASRPQKC